MRMEEVSGQKAAALPLSNYVLEVEGRNIQLDQYGYMVDPASWTRAVAEHMAALDGLRLSKEHWVLIKFLHRFYSEFEIAPSLGILSRNLCKDQYSCRWTRRYIRQLFPNGAKTACRYAGLPSPVMDSCV